MWWHQCSCKQLICFHKSTTLMAANGCFPMQGNPSDRFAPSILLGYWWGQQIGAYQSDLPLQTPQCFLQESDMQADVSWKFFPASRELVEWAWVRGSSCQKCKGVSNSGNWVQSSVLINDIVDLILNIHHLHVSLVRPNPSWLHFRG